MPIMMAHLPWWLNHSSSRDLCSIVGLPHNIDGSFMTRIFGIRMKQTMHWRSSSGFCPGHGGDL